MLKEVTSQEFKEMYQDGVVVADFFSTTCGPCKMLSFVLADVDKTLGDKVKILKVDGGAVSCVNRTIIVYVVVLS